MNVAQWPVGVQTVLLLLASNVFMTFALYGHLKEPFKLDYVWVGVCMVGRFISFSAAPEWVAATRWRGAGSFFRENPPRGG